MVHCYTNANRLCYSTQSSWGGWITETLHHSLLGPSFFSSVIFPKEQIETIVLKFPEESGLYCSLLPSRAITYPEHIKRSVLIFLKFCGSVTFSMVEPNTDSQFILFYILQSCYCIFPVCIGQGPGPTFPPASAPPPFGPKAWACWLCHS